MNGSAAYFPAAEPRPRLWPGVVIVLLYWAAIKVPGWVAPGTMTQMIVSGFGSMAAVALFLLWWLLFSRVRWADRFLLLLAWAAVGGVAMALFHPTLRGSRLDETMMALTFNVLPVVFAGWIGWLVVARTLNRSVQTIGLLIVFVLTWGYFTTLRFDGTTGIFTPEFSFRWQPTAEEQFLAERGASPAATTTALAPPVELKAGDWPAFRGPARDGRLTGVRIASDWAQRPPKELWRHRVGPGWSSFAVVGNRLLTQEQRGEKEVVVCYDADTGKELWVHADETRFNEAVGGPGPRATPTFHGGRVYALGANGQLNCLDAATGKKVWSRDIAADSGAKVPMWGFSSSPLVVQGIVTVFAGGPEGDVGSPAQGKGVLGYKADTGDLAWASSDAKGSYCSMHPARFEGVEQLLISAASGLTAFEPTTGKVLWQYEWALGKDFNRVVQPALVGDSDVLIGSGFSFGLRRVRVTKDGDAWKPEQVWETKAISPYFNDFVVHKDHIYGFHNNLFACVTLADGKLKWKERGYDNGQVLLLADQDLLVIQAEKGDVALVEAKPEARKELARISALKSKTWNHPVVAHGKLYVRNGEEAVCYQLAEDNPAVVSGK